MGDMTVMQKQEIARGAEAMGAIVGRYAKRRSEKVISPLGTLSFWGKVLAVVAAGVMIASIGMIFFDASDIVVERGQKAVVARDTVNVRQAPSSNAPVVSKARSGESFNITGNKGSWTGVRTSDGKISGWIASALLNTRTARTLNFQYEMKGYFTIALIAMMVIFFALRMKKVPVEMSAGRRGSETLLVNND
ncbi:MAG: SH3 domain-containing protein [bacterium]|nr:SH3 domain-containing protein [bacterium]MDT8367105.1 SH3 domain-containing protein [bacterium]